MFSSVPQIYWGLVLFAADTTLVVDAVISKAWWHSELRSLYITYPHISFDKVTVLKMPWWWHCLTQFHNFLSLKIINCELSAILILNDSSWSMVCFIIWMLQEQSDQHKIIHIIDFYIWSLLHWKSLFNRVSVVEYCFWIIAIYMRGLCRNGWKTLALLHCTINNEKLNHTRCHLLWFDSCTVTSEILAELKLVNC